MVIYVDKEYKCHVADDGTMTAIEDPFFNDKCAAFIEGYCYEVRDNITSYYPWKPLKELEAAQRAYERQLLKDYEALINELYEEVTA